MLLRVSCELAFYIEVPTPFILMLRPQSSAQQVVKKNEYNLSPITPITEFTDDFGNLVQRLIAPPGFFTVKTTADVNVSEYTEKAPGADFVEVQKLPSEVLRYLIPSRYCESDRFSEMANSITRKDKPGYDQVKTIENWLRTMIQYTPGFSEFPISAIEVNHNQSGVCRDFAHLGIALCRSISIPARIAVGYLYDLKPMDMHAWFEAYVGGQWYTFDAVHTGPKAGYVVVGYGRDVADVALYNQFGPAVFPTLQKITVEKI